MKICFRFDIDTPKCLQRGVPALTWLSDSLAVPFTFYLNPGRSISWATVGKGGARRSAPKLTPVRKLGAREWLRTAVFNPQLRKLGNASKLVNAVQAGHEIGLHGGRNHALWHRNAHLWSERRLRAELAWGLSAFRKLGLSRPESFASPGWNGPAALPALLSGFGLQALADRRYPDEHGILKVENGRIALVSTRFAGEPGGVGFIETSVASGKSIKETVSSFEGQISRAESSACVLYDHPCFAGGEGLGHLRALIEYCLAEGFEITTVADIARDQLAEDKRP